MRKGSIIILNSAQLFSGLVVSSSVLCILTRLECILFTRTLRKSRAVINSHEGNKSSVLSYVLRKGQFENVCILMMFRLSKSWEL